MLENIPRKTKIAGVVTILLLVVAAIGYNIYTQTTRAGKIAVTIASAPADAAITIDNVRTSPGTVYLTPNQKHTVKAEKDGFETFTQEQYISSDRHTITINLVAVSEEAKKWAQDNQDDYMQVEREAGEAAGDEGAAFTNKNPITEALPYEDLIYGIGYRIDQSDPSGNTIILTIDAREGSRNAAVQQIRNLGYDPTQYKIEFNDYENPFAS